MGRCAGPYQQGAEYLPQCLCVQAVAGLRLGHLSQVGEEILQGEPVMQRYGGGVLNNQAHLSVLAFAQSTIWKGHSDGSNLHRPYANGVAALTQSENVWTPAPVKDSSVKVKITLFFVRRRTRWSISGIFQ